MGYYTKYVCEIHNTKEIDLELQEAALNTEIPYYECSLCEIGNCDETKWYDHEEDMKTISKDFPKIVFKLTGEGENPGDLWIKYFKNGKMQQCPGQIIYEEYNEKKLRK